MLRAVLQMGSTVEKAVSGRQTLPWLLCSRPAGTTVGRRCSFLKSKGQAPLEKAAVTRVGAAAMAELAS